MIPWICAAGLAIFASWPALRELRRLAAALVPPLVISERDGFGIEGA